MLKEDARAIERYVVRDRDTNIPNSIQTEEDVALVLSSLESLDSQQQLNAFSSGIAILKGEQHVSIDYSQLKYKLELPTLTEKENLALSDYLRINLPSSAETYGSAVTRMVFGDKVRKPQDVDIQLRQKDDSLAENLAETVCKVLNKQALFRTKFELALHDPRVCLLPSTTRRSVVRLKDAREPVVDIHIDTEEGSIPEYQLGFKRLSAVTLDGNVSRTDKTASTLTLRQR